MLEDHERGARGETGLSQASGVEGFSGRPRGLDHAFLTGAWAQLLSLSPSYQSTSNMVPQDGSLGPTSQVPHDSGTPQSSLRPWASVRVMVSPTGHSLSRKSRVRRTPVPSTGPA